MEVLLTCISLLQFQRDWNTSEDTPFSSDFANVDISDDADW